MGRSSRGRSSEYHYRSRELEDAIIGTVVEIADDAFQRRRLAGDVADMIIRVAEGNIGAMVAQLTDRYRDEYIIQDDVTRWCERVFNSLCKEALHALDVQEDDSRGGYVRRGGRDRDRDDYRYDDRNSRRSRRSMRTRNDDGSEAGIGWGNARRDKTEESEADRRARLAEESSRRLKEQERRDGVNQPRVNQVVNESEQRRISYDMPGITMTDDYAVIANRDSKAAPLALTASPVDKVNITQSTSNDLYRIEGKTNYGIGGVMTVQSIRLRTLTPFRSIENVLSMLAHDDSKLFNAINFCHVLTFNRLSVYNTGGHGMAMLNVMPRLEALFKDSQMNIQQRMLNLSIILNDVPDWVRNAYMARIIRKWNALARCRFALPGMPNDYLMVSSWEQLQSLFPESLAVDPSLTDKVIRLTLQGSVNEYASRLANGLLWVFKTTLLGRNGYIDVSHADHIGYLSQLDELPFVIDRKFRSRDLWRMNDEQRAQLSAQFMKDWYCSIEQVTAIVTNLKLDDVSVHPRVNCVSADDAPVACLFKEMIKQSDGYHQVYTCDEHANVKYVCHAGMISSGDLQLVTLNPNM